MGELDFQAALLLLPFILFYCQGILKLHSFYCFFCLAFEQKLHREKQPKTPTLPQKIQGPSCLWMDTAAQSGPWRKVWKDLIGMEKSVEPSLAVVTSLAVLVCLGVKQLWTVLHLTHTQPRFAHL